MKGVGVADNKAIGEQHLGRQREIVESDGGRMGGTEIDKWGVGCISHRQMEQKNQKHEQTSAFLPLGITVKNGSAK